MFKDTNVTIMVNDMDRALRFYTDTLGLKLKARYGDHFAEVEAPGQMTIALHPVSKNRPPPTMGERMSIGFAVETMDAAVASLKLKGVLFSSETDDEQVRLAFFSDPDGNPLYLSQSKWG